MGTTSVAVSIPTFEWLQFRVDPLSSQFPELALRGHEGEYTSVISIETRLNLMFGRTEAEVLSGSNEVKRSTDAPPQGKRAVEPGEAEPEYVTIPASWRVTREQSTLFRMLISDFIQEASAVNGTGLSNLPSYDRLVHGAYATGFVFVANHALAAAVYGRVREYPDALLKAPFSEVRLFVHYLMRDERWSDNGHPDGGGPIREALAEGHLHRLVERLPV
jgi:hypothetical protein